MSFSSSISNIEHAFVQASTSDDLWQELHKQLAPYKVSSVCYGLAQVPLLQQADKSSHSGVLAYFKTSYPVSLFTHTNTELLPRADMATLHCLYHTTPYMSSDKSRWLSDEERAERLAHEDKWYKKNRMLKEGRHIGVAIPVRHGKYGLGGLGLHSDNLTWQEFDDVWAEHKQTLTEIAQMFDTVARTKFDDLFAVKLTDREREIVFWLTQGDSAKAISSKLGTSPYTIENQIKMLRKKFSASNNVHLVAKIMTLTLI